MTVENPAREKSTIQQNDDGYSSTLDRLSEKELLFRGVRILGFSRESVAAKAGLHRGDIILKYDDVGNLTVDKLKALEADESGHRATSRIVFARDDQWRSVLVPRGSLGVSGETTSIRGYGEAPGRETDLPGSPLSGVDLLALAALYVLVTGIISFLVPTSWSARPIVSFLIPIVGVSVAICAWRLYLRVLDRNTDKSPVLEAVACGAALFSGMASAGWELEGYIRDLVRLTVWLVVLGGWRIHEGLKHRKRRKSLASPTRNRSDRFTGETNTLLD